MFGRPRSRGRSPLLRLLSLASVLALVLAGSADAYGLHRCVHHDALPGEAASAEAPAHGGHGAQHDHDAPASDSSEHDAGCTCVGDCAGAPAVLTPDEPTGITVAPVWVRVATPDFRPMLRHVAWLLPPANGPPALT